MGVTFTVLESAGDFRMADFYEQVDSFVAAGDFRAFTHDSLQYAATILASDTIAGAYIGTFSISPDETKFNVFALLEARADPVGDVNGKLTSSISAGMSGTQAISSVFAGDDTVFGFRHNDELWAFAGNDRMSGFSGNDVLHGGSGDDRLQGDRGRDALEGGNGRDRFDYADIVRGTAGGWGQDTILDFRQGPDKIEFLDTIGIRRFNDLSISDKNGDAVVSDAAGDTITLKGIAAASLTARDFAFVGPSQQPLDQQMGLHTHYALDWTNPHLVLA